MDTETSCITALAVLHSSTSNPAGLAACYNILAFDNVTGVFGAEIRVYRVARPGGGWVEVDKVDAGVVFEGARMLRMGGVGGVGKRDGKGSEVEVLVPAVGRGEAKDLWRRRNAVVLAYVGGIEIEGRVDGNVSLEAVDV